MVERNKRNRDFAETRTPVGVIGGIVGLVAASTAVAALVVAAATPAIAMVGLAASGTIGMFDNLPGYLEIDELSEKSNIYATGYDGTPVLLASFYDQNRVEVALGRRSSQYVKDAAIAGEDPRFYEHGGVDLQGTLRAAVTTASGRETQGGSSIAQQYVKNVRVQECEADHSTRTGQDDCYDAATETTIDASSKRCGSRSASRSATAKTRSCSATSTSRASAAPSTASRPPRTTTSARRRRTSRWRRRRRSWRS